MHTCALLHQCTYSIWQVDPHDQHLHRCRIPSPIFQSPQLEIGIEVKQLHICCYITLLPFSSQSSLVSAEEDQHKGKERYSHHVPQHLIHHSHFQIEIPAFQVI